MRGIASLDVFNQRYSVNMALVVSLTRRLPDDFSDGNQTSIVPSRYPRIVSVAQAGMFRKIHLVSIGYAGDRKRRCGSIYWRSGIRACVKNLLELLKTSCPRGAGKIRIFRNDWH
jgi:hypothetical protein